MTHYKFGKVRYIIEALSPFFSLSLYLSTFGVGRPLLPAFVSCSFSQEVKLVWWVSYGVECQSVGTLQMASLILQYYF